MRKYREEASKYALKMMFGDDPRHSAYMGFIHGFEFALKLLESEDAKTVYLNYKSKQHSLTPKNWAIWLLKQEREKGSVKQRLSAITEKHKYRPKKVKPDTEGQST